MTPEERREKRRQQFAAYYAKHADEIRARTRAWYAANSERAKEHQRKKRFDHPDKVKAIKAKYYAAHKERDNASNAQWRAKNQDRLAAYRISRRELSAEWNRKHPDAVRSSRHRRIATEKHAEGNWTAEDLATLRKILGVKCLAHGNHEGAITIDHIVPLAKGGTNYPTNLQPLCLKHNCAKGSRSCADYRTSEQVVEVLKAFRSRVVV